MRGISTFLDELRRRNVFRIGAAYVVSSWLLIQVAETLLPVFGFGTEPVRVIVILLATGFVPALVVSWLYEITPDGLKLETELRRDRAITRQSGKNLDRAVIVILAVAVTYFAVDKFLLGPARDATLTEAVSERVRGELARPFILAPVFLFK